jgi:hypothetical protein
LHEESNLAATELTELRGFLAIALDSRSICQADWPALVERVREEQERSVRLERLQRAARELPLALPRRCPEAIEAAGGAALVARGLAPPVPAAHGEDGFESDPGLIAARADLAAGELQIAAIGDVADERVWQAAQPILQPLHRRIADRLTKLRQEATEHRKAVLEIHEATAAALVPRAAAAAEGRPEAWQRLHDAVAATPERFPAGLLERLRTAAASAAKDVDAEIIASVL